MASLIHPSSSESVTSQLDLFSVPPTQTSLEDGFFTEYKPIFVLTSGGPVEFCIAAESSNYIDLANTFLYVKPHLHGRLFCERFFDKNESGKNAFTQRRL